MNVGWDLRMLLIRGMIAVVLLLAAPVWATELQSDCEFSASAVRKLGTRVADWQLANVWTPHSGRKKHHDLDWTNGALYAGMFEFCRITDDPKYLDWLRKIGEKHQWKLYTESNRPVYHADDHAVGQLYLNLYRLDQDEAMLIPTRECFDWILANPPKVNMDEGMKRWSWADCVNDEGMLTYVQPIGGAPGMAYADKTEVYGTGAFLAAAAEVYKMLGGKEVELP